METSIAERALSQEEAETVAERIWVGLVARANRDIKPVFLALLREILIDEAPSWKKGLSAEAIAKTEYAMEGMRTGNWPKRRKGASAKKTKTATPPPTAL